MSKNDKITTAVKRTDNILKDKYFKELLRYKVIAAVIAKFTVKEIKDWDIISIAKAIEDTNPRNPNMTDLEILGCEVDFKNVQYGNLNEKETIADTVFTLNLNGNKIDIAIGNRLLLNVEMQQKTDPKQLGYDIVSRAIYYGASALRSTVSQGDTKYVGICKSYSVWFCSNSLDLSEIGNTQKGYKNIFKIARTHDDINLVEVNGANYDLIEIVMIDLPKLCKVNTREAEIIKTLFYETKEIFSILKDNYNIQFNYEIKGVSEIMNFVKEMEIERAEARAEGRAEGEVKVYNKLGYTAEQIAKEVNLPLEDVQEIIDMLNSDY